ncbi:acyltransferase family protein [Spirosoma fluviale]|uniref:Fucose 4-O-acetylase n=1 Tax=Spirosoma fluviale TaxID=1597977 RepID=A0A286GXB9_9BACT|nr:acyltransferase [Spirosoma fluviale]SOD99816.1 Fucose 4-O-acetylase [Spirosoma fluviale]
MNPNERFIYIDRLKGVAIVLVVIGHIIQFNTVESSQNVLFGIIYSFHMPLFMFISGYLAQKTVKDSIYNNYLLFLKKKAQSLLIPYFVWSLVVDKLFFVEEIHYSLKDPITLIKNGSGLWFLLYLFLLYLTYSAFFYVSIKINKRIYVLVDILIICLLLLCFVLVKKMQLVSYIDSLTLYFLFFFSGVIISKYQKIKNVMLEKYTFSIFLTVFLILSIHYKFTDTSLFNKLIKLIVAYSAIMALYYITIKISWNAFVDRCISYCGRNSLIIYATHFRLAKLVSGLFLLPHLDVVPLVCISLFASIIIICISFGIAKVVELSPLLNFLLYGKSERNFLIK